ncbi:hypothetical protein [Brevundimonas sp. TSRC1-1]|uniref:hypothetical protein n=1 Tax=Brevundimonas sp. TSRC1-1 TaxID=2804562 RepID=UPI003CF0DC2E
MDAPLYIDVEAMLRSAGGGDLAAKGLAMTLVFGVWEPGRQPFAYDPDQLFERLSAGGHTGITRDELEQNKAGAQRYFVVLDDGRWVPSPEFFSVTDGNPGGNVV